jgi:hypothetical protein
MSDTPETDAKAHSIFGNHSCATVLADFARKLERERDEARKKLEEEMKWHHQTHKELVETQCKLLDIEYDKLKS